MSLMSELEEILLKKARTFMIEEASTIRHVEQLLTLPCYNIKEISEVDSGKIKTLLNINNIKELAEIDIDNAKGKIKEAKWDFSTFEKWVIAAKIITRISNYEVSESKKISLLGLENAGKTAMREVILRKYKGSPSLFNKILRKLQPTKGVERENISILDANLQLWDMGGQETYRENYLREPERFLLDIEVIIYVIDVQDNEKYNQTIEYLKKLAATFRALNQGPFFLICYHKYDPEFLGEKYKEWMENSWNIIQGILDEYDFPRKRFTTSIFDDITIFNVFSEALKIVSDYNVGKIINKILEKHAQEAGLQNLILISENGMELGEYIKGGADNSEELEQLYQFAVHTLNSINQLGEIDKLMRNKKYIKSILYTFYADNANFLMNRVLLFDRSIYVATMDPKKKELDIGFTRGLLPWLTNLFT